MRAKFVQSLSCFPIGRLFCVSDLVSGSQGSNTSTLRNGTPAFGGSSFDFDHIWFDRQCWRVIPCLIFDSTKMALYLEGNQFFPTNS